MASRRRLEERFAFASHAVHHHRLHRRPVLEALEGRVVLSTFTVNSLGDAGSGSNDSGDLRYCINQANASDQANAIVFDSTVFGTPQTITLDGSQLELEDTGGTQTITAPAAGVTISGGGNSRVFQVDADVTASISGLTISGGSISGSNGGGLANYGTATLTNCTLSGNYAAVYGDNYNSGEGGGLANSGTANLTGCTISGNTASSGGGLENLGTANLIDCTLSGNTSYGFGGGLENYGAGNVTLTMTGCTVSGNTSYYDGGGVANSGYAMSLTDCTLSGNTSYHFGGGEAGTANLTGCTISGNSAAAGGGLYENGTANLTGCTISGNSAVSNYGGGLLGYYGQPSLTDTIVAGNTSSSGANDIDAFGSFSVSGSDNLVGIDRTGSLFDGQDGNIVGVAEPLLAPLGNYGGSTQTMALLPGSPAIGGGIAVSGVITDQRGDPLDTPNPDIGAFQSQGFSLTPAAKSTPQSTATGTAFANPLVVTVTADNPIEPVAGGILTFTAPASGPSANLSATTVTIGSNGFAAVTATANFSAGSYTVTASAGGARAADFALTNSNSASLIPLTFSDVNDQTITYGTSSMIVSGTLANGSQAPVGESVALTLDGIEQSATIEPGGAFSTTFNATGLTVAGVPYPISYAYTSDGTYASASTSSMLTVDPATLTIAAQPETKVYGTADPALAYTASGFQFNDTASAVLTGASSRAQSGTLAGEQAGGFVISQGTLAGDSNYTISFTDNTLTITPASLTVSANPQTKVYGTNDPSLTDTATGFINTTVDGVAIADTAATVLSGHLTRAAGETVAGGPYAIAPGTLAANSNYTMSFTSSTLIVTLATLTITAEPETKVYGTADLALAYTASGFEFSDTAATVLTGTLARAQFGTSAGEQVGDYAIAQGTLTADSNYTITFTGNTLTITPALLTVTAAPQTKVYGTADPTLTDTPTGFIDTTVDGVAIDDTAATVLTGALARAHFGTAAGEQVGDYPITEATLAASSNYTIAFTGNTLTVTPAPLTVIANPRTKVYGSADPSLADAVTGLVNTTVDGVTIADNAATALTGHLARAAGETVAGSPYAITQGTLAANSNYTIHFTGSSLSITPSTPTVTVSALSGTYTGAPIAAMATVTGVNGTAARSLEAVTPTVTYYAGTSTLGTDLGSAAPSVAGTYTVVARFPGSADYAAAFSKPATFAIAPATVTIALTSTSGSPAYGQAVTFVATVNSTGGTPGGTVTFADGTTPLATIPLGGSGQAAVTMSTLSLGSHAITATYNGGTDFLGVKSGTTAESVSPAATTIVLKPHAVLKRKKVLKAVELTATIEPVAPGGGVPTGTVAFEFLTKRRNKVKVTTLGTAAMSGGTATLTFKPNKVLNKPLTIVYSGDPEFLASTMSPPKLTKKAMM